MDNNHFKKPSLYSDVELTTSGNASDTINKQEIDLKKELDFAYIEIERLQNEIKTRLNDYFDLRGLNHLLKDENTQLKLQLENVRIALERSGVA